MGKLIVVEGLDGSGKATQAKLLAEKLKEMGKEVIQVSFPDYDSDSSALVKMYLSGKFGSHAQDVNAYAASAFYAVDRFASYKTSWQKAYENGRIIIADTPHPTACTSVQSWKKINGMILSTGCMTLNTIKWEYPRRIV